MTQPRIYCRPRSRIAVSFYANKLSPLICEHGICLHHDEVSVFGSAHAFFKRSYPVMEDFYGVLVRQRNTNKRDVGEIYLSLLKAQFLRKKMSLENTDAIDDVIAVLENLDRYDDCIVWNNTLEWCQKAALAIFGENCDTDEDSDELKHVRNFCVQVAAYMLSSSGYIPEPFYETTNSSPLKIIDNDPASDNEQSCILLEFSGNIQFSAENKEWLEIGEIVQEIKKTGGISKMRIFHNYLDSLYLMDDTSRALAQLEEDVEQANHLKKALSLDFQHSNLSARRSATESLGKIAHAALDTFTKGGIPTKENVKTFLCEVNNLWNNNTQLKLAKVRNEGVFGHLLKEGNKTGWLLEVQDVLKSND